jgi:hypothetical protein
VPAKLSRLEKNRPANIPTRTAFGDKKTAIAFPLQSCLPVLYK